ncbi:MAG TPA: hypothetical protein VK856_05720, partial [Anaerolineaceae bacterium]|nr:hypothetical protein [Anaerolineaceae bacterium]
MDINQLLSQINPIVILVVLGSFALILLLIGIIVTIASERRSAEMTRLGRYIEDEDTLSDQERARPLVDWLNSRVERSTMGERISKSLSRADLKFKPGEYVFLIFLSALIGG